MVLGAIIGTGIYLKPAEMAREAGTPILMMGAWIVAGLLALLGALCVSELGAALPEAGGQYAFLKRSFRGPWGFLYGWKTVLLSGPASQASLASGLMLFVSYLLPSVAQPLFESTISLPFLGTVPMVMTRAQPLAALAIWVIAIGNLFSVRRVGGVQILLSAFKVVSLVVIIGLGVTLVGHGDVAGTARGVVQPLSAPTVSGFLAAVAAGLWAFSGWYGLTQLGGEIARPGTTLPRAVITGFLITVVLFVAFNVVTLLALPFDQVAWSPHVASDMLERVAGADASVWLTVAMIGTVIGTINSTVFSTARVPFAMARDGLFFRPLARLSPRTRVPRVAVIFQATLASALVLTGTFEDLTSLFIFANWLFLAITVGGLIRLRSTEPNLPRPFRVRPYPLAPVLFVVLSVILTVSILLARPGRTGLGLLVILAGWPVYRRFQSRGGGPTVSGGPRVPNRVIT